MKRFLSCLAVVMGGVTPAVTTLHAAGKDGGVSFLRAGDRWTMTGDSITHYDLYRQKVERLQRHFHPGVPVAITQAGVAGVGSGHQWEGVAAQATVVSIMLGMNNYINSNVVYGVDTAPTLAAYRQDMEKQIQEFRKGGAVVLLLSPTLTDPRFDHGLYELRGGEVFLRACAGILQELAAKSEGVYYIPVQEEFEALQGQLGNYEILRLDGVHPTALGQYQIARTLWEHLNLTAPMINEGPRSLATPPPPLPLPVVAALAKRMIQGRDDGIRLLFKAQAPQTVTATWSAGDARASEKLELPAGETAWQVPVPPAFLEMKPGQMRDVVVDLAAADGRRSIYFIDLACVPVLHAKDGKFAGTLTASQKRPEGDTVATWTAEIKDKGLYLAGEVFDNDLEGQELWPWGRDGVGIWLDFRPGARFAGIGIDEDVSLSLLTVLDQPAFTCTLIPWVGRGMHLAADAGGERTATGYRWRLFVHRYFTKKQPVDVTQRDFLGFNVVVADQDRNPNGTFTANYFQAHRPEDGAVDKHPNCLMLLDLKNQIAADTVINVSLYGR